MGLQLLVKSQGVDAVASALGDLAKESEIFAAGDGLIGVSVPTKVMSTVNEQAFFDQLASLEYYELWSGLWRKPTRESEPASVSEPKQKPKWKLW